MEKIEILELYRGKQVVVVEPGSTADFEWRKLGYKPRAEGTGGPAAKDETPNHEEAPVDPPKRKRGRPKKSTSKPTE